MSGLPVPVAAVELHAHGVAGRVQRLRPDHERVEVEVAGLGRDPAAVAEAAQHLDDPHRVEPADAPDDVLAVGREDVVLRLRGVAGADLRGLLADARDPERELALPLQVAGLDVEAADDHHLPVEVRSRASSSFSIHGRYSAVDVVFDEGSLGREQLDRRLGVGHENYPSPAFSGVSRRVSTTSAAASRSFSTDSASPIETRMPSGGNTRATIPCASSISAAAAVCSPVGEPDEVALRLREVASPASASPSRDAAAPLDEHRRPGPSSSASWSSAASAARWAGSVTESGIAVARAASRMYDGPDRVPDAQPGEAVRLRERAQHDEVGVALEQRAAARRPRAGR